ncbi:hypothetical protein N7456_012074 [Penicillium angulare]|uniref:BTB domain-containing protein n=1 Tax=Penicillium angulare TaxID=116970 RepID=A0A9W9EUW1_9EURO|nr:hypothetical protein N7456_012074 [Penicillium angulare]
MLSVEPGIDRIDAEGDVILVLKDEGGILKRKFQVSSKAMSLASPVFKRLFSPGFREGNELHRDGRATVSLGGDDPMPMHTMLLILHHCPPREAHVTAEQMVKIAIHADKYDCLGPIASWMTMWLSQLSLATVEEHGLVLLATHYLRSGDLFSTYSAKAQIQLALNFHNEWADIESLALMPDSIRKDLKRLVKGRIRLIDAEIHAFIDRIATDTSKWKSWPLKKTLCTSCGQVLIEDARKHHACDNQDNNADCDCGLRTRYLLGSYSLVQDFG